MTHRSAFSRLLATRLLFLSICLLVFAESDVFAGESLLTLDPAATEVTFTLPATGHEVHGVLHLKSGSIRYDQASGAVSGSIEIDAGRTVTGNESRDRKMHSTTLQSTKYPLIIFKATRIEGRVATTGSSHFDFHGIVSIAGADHALTLPSVIDISGDKLTATSVFFVPFVAWGLPDPSFFLVRVAKEVKVTVKARGTVTATD